MSVHRRRARTQDDFPGRGRAAASDDTSSHASRYARVSRLATDQANDKDTAQAKINDVDPSLLARIQKMLKLAQHPNTSEAEARQALRASTRMLSAANLTEAEVMSHENAAEQLQRAGHSIVTVRHKDGKAVSLEAWSVTLGHAINVAFNVKFFYTRFSSHSHIDFTFYGLRDNTVAAAISFEAVFNLALSWAASRTDVKGRTGKNSYLIGLSDSLYRMASKDKKAEEAKAIETEKRAIQDRERASKQEEQRKNDRLEASTLASLHIDDDNKAAKVEDGDDDDDDIVFVRIKPGRGASTSDVHVKEEPIDLDDDNDDGGFTGLGEGGEGDSNIDADEGEVEDDMGDLDAERRRFDAVYDNQPKVEVLQELSGNAPVKEEALGDLDGDVKPSIVQQTVNDAVKQESALGSGHAAENAQARVIKDEGEDDAAVPSWQSHAQLVTFKESAARLADDYLLSINTKLHHSKAKPKRSMRDNDAYRKGTEDGRKVDLKRRRLE